MSNSSPSKEESKKPQEDEKEKANSTTKTCETGTSCDLYTEYTDDDEQLFKKIELTEHQLKLKDTDRNAFWKSVSETIRVDLSDALADNEDTHNIKNIMKSENKSLLKDCARLEKLAKEAQEIVNQMANMV